MAGPQVEPLHQAYGNAGQSFLVHRRKLKGVRICRSQVKGEAAKAPREKQWSIALSRGARELTSNKLVLFASHRVGSFIDIISLNLN